MSIKHGLVFREVRITEGLREIGKDKFGSLYNGSIDDGRQRVVVKKIDKISIPSGDQKQNPSVAQLMNLAYVQHENVVRLLGIIQDTDTLDIIYERLVVDDPQSGDNAGNDGRHRPLKFDDETSRDDAKDDEFQGYNSLHHVLHKCGDKDNSRDELTLLKRLEIAVNSGRAMKHMHTHQNHFVHGDFRSENVLLGPKFSPKISNFGLSNLISHPRPNDALVREMASFRDPNFHTSLRFSQESDVYCFGMFLLELFTGKDVFTTENSKAIEELRSAYDKWTEYKQFDESILTENHETAVRTSSGDIKVSTGRKFAMRFITGIILDCMHDDVQLRREMTGVVNLLQHIQDIIEQDKLPNGTGVNPSGNVLPDSVNMFSEDDIKRISDDYRHEIKIPDHRHKIYKGVIENVVAVVKVYQLRPAGSSERNVNTEFNALKTIRHKNVARIIGYCFNDNLNAVVFNYVPGRNLLHCLRSEQCTLTLNKRLVIAIQVANALAYMHSQSPALAHLSPDARNIMLDNNSEPVLIDFADSKCNADNESCKKDVTVFGILLIQLITVAREFSSDSTDELRDKFIEAHKRGRPILTGLIIADEQHQNLLFEISDMAAGCIEKPSRMSYLVSRLEEILETFNTRPERPSILGNIISCLNA